MSHTASRPSDGRPCLSFSHVEVIDDCPDVSSLVPFLHNSYLNFFEDMDEAALASQALCVADMLWQTEDYSALIAGMSLSCYNTQRKGSPPSLTPIDKPYLFEFFRRKRLNEENAKTVFADSPVAGYGMTTLHTEIIPSFGRQLFLSRTFSSRLSEDQVNHIRSVCSFSRPGLNFNPFQPQRLASAWEGERIVTRTNVPVEDIEDFDE
eukprot:c2806_g1_i3.p1 GENE.c2806_g1_i3~~c2806_g1_i3.p1  ORF type:complete len:208 (-),score=46.74 c2806_g1_i3:13-636(-)